MIATYHQCGLCWLQRACRSAPAWPGCAWASYCCQNNTPATGAKFTPASGAKTHAQTAYAFYSATAAATPSCMPTPCLWPRTSSSRILNAASSSSGTYMRLRCEASSPTSRRMLVSWLAVPSASAERYTASSGPCRQRGARGGDVDKQVRQAGAYRHSLSWPWSSHTLTKR